MENVLLVVHLLVCIALVATVLLQRSEGGALGMGGGGTGGLISGRGVAGVLVKTTSALAVVFFITSLVLTRLNTEAARAPSEVERALESETGPVFDPLAPQPSAPSTAAPAAAADPLAPPPAASTPVAPAPSAPIPPGTLPAETAPATPQPAQ